MGHPAQGVVGEKNRGEDVRLRVVVNAAPAHQTVARIGILVIRKDVIVIYIFRPQQVAPSVICVPFFFRDGVDRSHQEFGPVQASKGIITVAFLRGLGFEGSYVC